MAQYLTFLVENEFYAIDLTNILEIADVTDVIKIPRQPKYVTGIISMMGRNLPVLDMRQILEKGENRRSTGCILIVDIEGVKAGFAIDKVDEVIVLTERRNLPEYLTILKNTELLNAKQMKTVQELEHWNDRQKKVQINSSYKKEARNHF